TCHPNLIARGPREKRQQPVSGGRIPAKRPIVLVTLDASNNYGCIRGASNNAGVPGSPCPWQELESLSGPPNPRRDPASCRGLCTAHQRRAVIGDRVYLNADRGR